MRPKRGAPVETVDALDLLPEGGSVQQNQRRPRKPSEKRGVTLLSKQQWSLVQNALAEQHPDLPWTARRANVLLDTDALAALGLPVPPSIKPALPGRKDADAPWDDHHLLGLVGRRVRLGEALIEITVETKPCAHIDKLVPGLRAALLPSGRGGVCARTIEKGRVQTGDTAWLLVD